MSGVSDKENKNKSNEENKIKEELKSKKEDYFMKSNFLVWFSVYYSNVTLILAALWITISTIISIITLIVANTLEKEIITFYLNSTNTTNELTQQSTAWASWMCGVGYFGQFGVIFFGIVAIYYAVLVLTYIKNENTRIFGQSIALLFLALYGIIDALIGCAGAIQAAINISVFFSKLKFDEQNNPNFVIL